MISGMRVRRRGAARAQGEKFAFYRLSITNSSGVGVQVIIRNLFLHGPGMPSGVPAGGTATASHTQSEDYLPENAFDGSEGSQWSSGVSGSYPRWLQYELATPKALRSYGIQAGTARYPVDFEFLGSHDGVTWVTLDSQAGLSWTALETKTFPL